jgi:hypothetical protein
VTRIFNVFALQHQFAQDETVFPHLGSSHLRFVSLRGTNCMPPHAKGTLPIAMGFKRPVSDVTGLF